MAMKALVCPQCDGQLELDDSKEFGFCQYCGTKIMLHETVQHLHKGQVQMTVDNSAQGRNRITLGNRAFEGKNYSEALRFYNEGLVDCPNDFQAIYRKGICTVMLARDDDLRLSELAAALRSATRVWSQEAASGDARVQERCRALAQEEFADLNELAFCFLKKTETYFNQLSNLEGCHAQAARWCEIAQLLDLITCEIQDDGINEPLLDNAVSAVDAWLQHDGRGEIRYFSHSTTDKKGNRTDHFAKYKMDKSRLDILTKARASMAERFNNLSSRISRRRALEDEHGRLQAESDRCKKLLDASQVRYDEAVGKFWEENPDLTARRKKTKGLSWISVGVGATLFLVSLIFLATIYIPLIGALLLALSFFIRSWIVKRSQKKLEKEFFPAEIKALHETLESDRHTYYEAESHRRSKQSEISALDATRK